MVEAVIEDLIPILTETLAITALLNALGNPPAGVTIYDTSLDNVEPTNCYIRIYDMESRQEVQQFLGGANRAYAEWQDMGVEYVGFGGTANESASRVGYLKLATEATIESYLKSNAIAQRNDLAGSNSYDKVLNFLITTMTPQPKAAGPNKDKTTKQWKCYRYSKVRLMVVHGLIS
jgi:hypothetical protein